jgi:hypothetical protein
MPAYTSQVAASCYSYFMLCQEVTFKNKRMNYVHSSSLSVYISMKYCACVNFAVATNSAVTKTLRRDICHRYDNA